MPRRRKLGLSTYSSTHAHRTRLFCFGVWSLMEFGRTKPHMQAHTSVLDTARLRKRDPRFAVRSGLPFGWQGSWGSTSSRRLHPLRPRLCDAGETVHVAVREGSPAHSLLHLFPLAGAAASLSVPPRRLEGSWSDRLFVSRAGFSWGPADALASARAGTAPRRVSFPRVVYDMFGI